MPIQKVKNQWLSEVYLDEHWLPLDEWLAKYEPPPPPDSKFMTALKASLTNTILKAVESGVVSKLVLMILELTCRILNRVETGLAEHASAEMAMQMVNNLSGIVLTYRFEQSKKLKKSKAAFLRTTAIEKLTACIENMGDDLSEAQKKLRSKLSSMEGVKAMIEEKLDKMLSIAETKSVEVEAKVDEKLEEADAILEKAGIERPPVIDEKREDLKDKKDELVGVLATVLRNGILGKLDTLADQVSYFIDKLFVQAALVKARAAESNESLQDGLTAVVEEIYNDMLKAVQEEVGTIFLLVGNMTEEEGEGGGDEE